MNAASLVALSLPLPPIPERETKRGRQGEGEREGVRKREGRKKGGSKQRDIEEH